MNWMEIIKVQTAGCEASKKCRDYLEQYKPGRDGSGPTAIKRYDNATIAGWHAIVLTWTTDSPKLPGSGMARALIHELKQFGMVDHSVWIAPDS